jgi:hypothetical protein
VSPADILTSDKCVKCEARGELGGQDQKFWGDFRWSNELSRATLVLDWWLFQSEWKGRKEAGEGVLYTCSLLLGCFLGVSRKLFDIEIFYKCCSLIGVNRLLLHLDYIIINIHFTNDSIKFKLEHSLFNWGFFKQEIKTWNTEKSLTPFVVFNWIKACKDSSATRAVK